MLSILNLPRAGFVCAASMLIACMNVEAEKGTTGGGGQTPTSAGTGAGGPDQPGTGGSAGKGGVGGTGGSSGQGGSGGGTISQFSLSPPTTSDVFAFTDIELADLDGDGCAELVLTGTGSPPRINVYPSACNGSFSGPPIVHPLTTFDDMALGDIDGDGRADVFTRDTGAPPRVTVRKIGTSFQLGPPVTNPVWTFDGLWVGDVNGDGRADALTAHFGATPPTVFLWSGPGDGSLAALSNVTPPRFDVGAFGSDFLIGSAGSPPNATWLVGDSSGAISIGTPQNLFTFSAFALGDLDGDGDADLLTDVPGNDWVISLYRNENASFDPPMLMQGFSYWALRSADVDGDGKHDVIIAPTGSPPRVTVWLSKSL